MPSTTDKKSITKFIKVDEYNLEFCRVIILGDPQTRGAVYALAYMIPTKEKNFQINKENK